MLVVLFENGIAKACESLPGRVRTHGAGPHWQARTVNDTLHRKGLHGFLTTEGLILAQNERWRRGLGMQVARERHLRVASTAANG